MFLLWPLVLLVLFQVYIKVIIAYDELLKNDLFVMLNHQVFLCLE